MKSITVFAVAEYCAADRRRNDGYLFRHRGAGTVDSAAALQFGVDPVHLGIIMLANLEIGYCTPPVGINLFIASQRFQKPILTLFLSTLPFLGIMLLWLAILTYIPQLSTWWK